MEKYKSRPLQKITVVFLETKVQRGTKDYLRTNIPTSIAKKLGLKPGDVLLWDLEKRENEEIILIRVRPSG